MPELNLTNTKERPFGYEEGDPLIVCLGDTHRQEVANAFKMKAMYTTSWLQPLMSNKFKKIIVFRPKNLSEDEWVRFESWLRQIVIHVDNKNDIFVV